MRILKVGDTVTAALFGGQLVTGKVLDIEITKEGEKEGRSVSKCNLDKWQHGVLDLDCGHWCYFYQIKFIN